ncbi:MAG: SDR family oxidoreductase [Actinobacteria bacterium]|nr:SDR family oxidoreductase [Actinomycetota bacterium]
MEHFAPRVGIVTGGAHGIGRALAAEVVARGGLAVLADRDDEGARTTAAELTALGPGRAVAEHLDVADSAAVQALVEKVAAEHGRLDLMANNAGILFSGPLEEFTDHHWSTAIDVNLRGVVAGTRAAYAVMAQQESRRGRPAGVILNTGSLAGLIPAPRMAPYTSTKWAVVGFSQAVRHEAASHGIQVNVLCPGYVDTKLIDEVFEPTASYVRGSFRRNTKALQPRLLTPEVVARKAFSGIEKDKPVIIVGGFAHLSARAMGVAPAVVRAGSRLQAIREERQSRKGA